MTVTDQRDLTACKQIGLGKLTFNVLDVGEGTPVLLLHGFPASHRLWRHQVGPLVDAGYRVIAPDLRGMGETSKPQAVGDYAATRLIGDVLGILNELGVRRSHVVAHDWGAFLGWSFAALMPRRVDHLVAISVGHPQTFVDVSLEQRARSWYMLLYQFPEAEAILRRGNWSLLRDLYTDEVDGARFISDLKRPGALTAGLNWYRANRHPSSELDLSRRVPSVEAPTLGIWGAGDRALTEETMKASGAYVRGHWQYERIEAAGHYVPVDAPERLTELIVGFLGSHATSTPLSRRRYQ